MKALFLKAKFKLQILNACLALQAEAWNDGDPSWVNRGKDGRFGGSQNSSESPDSRDIIGGLNNLLEDRKKFESIKDATYQALSIENPDILESSFMTGYGSPDLIQKIAFKGLSQVAGFSTQQVESLIEDIKKDPDSSIKEIFGKYEESTNSPPAKLSARIIETYLKHKKKI